MYYLTYDGNIWIFEKHLILMRIRMDYSYQILLKQTNEENRLNILCYILMLQFHLGLVEIKVERPSSRSLY